MLRNPVLIIMSLLAGLSAVLGLTVFQDLVNPTVLGWLLVAQAAITATLQFWVRGEVTPVDSHRSRQGLPLVPVRRVPADATDLL